MATIIPKIGDCQSPALGNAPGTVNEVVRWGCRHPIRQGFVFKDFIPRLTSRATPTAFPCPFYVGCPLLQ